jgi:hypothetical protein
MFLTTLVLDWHIDGGRRVPDKVNGNLYLLNTNRMYELRSGVDTDPTMYFFDNPADTRCGGAILRTDHTQATVANIITEGDDVPSGKFVTVSAYPNNDSSLTTESITLPKAQIAYCYPYGNVQSHALSWIVFAEDAWNMRRILVNHSWIPLKILLEV